MKLAVIATVALAMVAFPTQAENTAPDLVAAYTSFAGEAPPMEVRSALALIPASSAVLAGAGDGAHVGDIRTTCVTVLGENCFVRDVTGTATIQDDHCQSTTVTPEYRHWDGSPGIVEIGEGDHYAATMDDRGEHNSGTLVGTNCIHDLLGLVLYVNGNGIAEFA